jgi:hypothetical protein
LSKRNYSENQTPGSTGGRKGKRTECFVQFILPGSRDDNLEEVDRVANWILDNTDALIVSTKPEEVDDGGN